MNGQMFSCRLAIAALILLSTIVIPVAVMADDGSDNRILTSVRDTMDQSLEQIDANLTEIAGVFGTADMSKTTADAIVRPYQKNQDGIGGVILVNGETRFTVLNPQYLDNSSFDASLLDDMTVNYTLTNLRPAMSQARETINGTRVVMISRPALVGDRIGAAITLIIPEEFCRALLKPYINGTTVQGVVMQPDGTILYAILPDELKNTPPENFLTEYPTFRDVKNAMMTSAEGKMGYELWRIENSAEPVAREASWSTVNIHGNEWRVMIAEPV